MLPSDFKEKILKKIKKIPIVDTLDIKFLHFSDGYCKIWVPRKLCYNGVYESFHGGLLMTIADSAACFAIFTRTGPDVRLTTTDMNIRFLAPCLSDVTAEARVIKFGRTMCPVIVDLFDESNKHVALAHVNYMLLNS